AVRHKPGAIRIAVRVANLHAALIEILHRTSATWTIGIRLHQLSGERLRPPNPRIIGNTTLNGNPRALPEALKRWLSDWGGAGHAEARQHHCGDCNVSPKHA